VAFIVTALTGHPALNVAQILAIDLGTNGCRAWPGTENQAIDAASTPRACPGRSRAAAALFLAGLIGALRQLFCWVRWQANHSDWGWLDFIDRLGNMTGLRALGRPHAVLLAVTMFHAGVVMAQVGNAFACRTEKQRGRTLGWFSNRSLLLSIAVEIGLILCLIYVPGLAAIFDHRRLPGWPGYGWLPFLWPYTG
jgi:magnesium-transporting ATPase (P-type)